MRAKLHGEGRGKSYRPWSLSIIGLAPFEAVLGRYNNDGDCVLLVWQMLCKLLHYVISVTVRTVLKKSLSSSEQSPSNHCGA